MRRYFDSFYEVMDEIRFEAHRFEDLNDGRVLVPMTLSARGRATGLEAEQRLLQVWQVRDGLAYRVWVYADEAEARAAVDS